MVKQMKRFSNKFSILLAFNKTLKGKLKKKDFLVSCNEANAFFLAHSLCKDMNMEITFDK